MTGFEPGDCAVATDTSQLWHNHCPCDMKIYLALDLNLLQMREN